MGDYTEFHFNAQLKANTPSEVVVTLNQMLGHTKIGQERPKHPLFSTDRWDIMLTCDSAYFDAESHSTLRYKRTAESYYLCIRSNFKHYDKEIPLFLDWIHPHLDKLEGGFLGFYRYEETEIPTLLYMVKKGILQYTPPDPFLRQTEQP